jgi:hypothetical protein
MEKASLEFGPAAVRAFCLDEIKDPVMQQDLLRQLVSLPHSITKSILLCMLPHQAL